MNYYKKQLEGLKNTEYYKTIQISDGDGYKTNNIDLSLHSISVIIDFLIKEQARLVKVKTESLKTLDLLK